MSKITIKEKVVQQATQLVIMGQQVNFLLRELYKSKPDHEIFIKNINLAAGLINSDGYTRRIRDSDAVLFGNTCLSIVFALKECLLYNNIYFREYSYPPKIDKRNGETLYAKHPC